MYQRRHVNQEIWRWEAILVGGFSHLEKYESQLGRIIPYIMEHKIHVPNHQPAIMLQLVGDWTPLRNTGQRETVFPATNARLTAIWNHQPNMPCGNFGFVAADTPKARMVLHEIEWIEWWTLYIYTHPYSHRVKMPPHTCSELSVRILLWNASAVQKHQRLIDTMKKIYIYIHIQI